MHIIKKYVDRITDEIHGANDYTECYIEAKIDNNLPLAEKYHKMATDELNHLKINHEIAVQKIDAAKRYFKPTEEMIVMWEETHRNYVETVDTITKALSM